MTGPEIKQLTQWHQPNLILRAVQMNGAII
jgi:hypothetical protein